MLDFGYVSMQERTPDLEGLSNADWVAFDAETSGVDTATDIPYGFSITHRETDAFYTTMHNRFFTDILEDDSVIKIAHNAKFDRSMFKKAGILVDNLCDPMIGAHLLEEQRLSLKVLLNRLVSDFKIDIRQYPQFEKWIPHATLQEMALHFGPHSSGALVLWNRVQRELRANGLWNVFWGTEMPLVNVLSDMELDGVLIDMDVMEGLGKQFQNKIDVYEELLRTISGHKDTNFNSADQVAPILYDEFKVPKPPKWQWTSGGRPSMDKKWLEPFAIHFPIVKHYIAYKQYRHLRDTYVNGIVKRLVDGRIYTNFNQTRTRTGRLSSTDPNLQNIPMRTEIGRRIRNAFVAPPGKVLLKADYIQMELKKEAMLSGCKALLDAFKNDEDIHTATAIRMFGDAKRRAEGKTENFRLIYGGGTEEQQKKLFEAYPEVKVWMNKMFGEFADMGYAKTMRGRKEHLGDLRNMPAKEAGHMHKAGLSVMNQGSCSEIVKEGMVRVWKQIRDTDVKLLLQVHDELILEVPEKDQDEVVQMLHKEMTFHEGILPMTIDVSVGHSWGEMEKLPV